MLRIISIIITLSFSASLRVTEVDNVTDRFVSLRDARFEVNRIVAGYFHDAIITANKKNSCDPWNFLNALSDRIGSGFYANIERDAAKDANIDKHLTKRKDSIYRDFTILESPGIFVAHFGHLIRIGDTVIGVDKLGHFLSTGFSYFKRMYRDGMSFEQILKFGEKTERTYFGLAFTGIYSYADLAANIDGFRFWERVLGYGPEASAEPFIKCKNNQWFQNAHFDCSDYVNEAWDEGINCSRFRTKKMKRKVDERLQKLERERGGKFTCPIAREACSTMIARYQESAQSVISPLCF